MIHWWRKLLSNSDYLGLLVDSAIKDDLQMKMNPDFIPIFEEELNPSVGNKNIDVDLNAFVEVPVESADMMAINSDGHSDLPGIAVHIARDLSIENQSSRGQQFLWREWTNLSRAKVPFELVAVLGTLYWLGESDGPWHLCDSINGHCFGSSFGVTIFHRFNFVLWHLNDAALQSCNKFVAVS
jgi:hypothetical protein